MSGLEIAGLVLGAFPIVCGAARELEGVFQNAVSWWEFETSFENLIAGIRTQEIAYQQVLERLVEHLDVSEDEYNSLVGDQDSPLWSEPWIRNKVEKRFHEKTYSWINENLDILRESVAELQQLLPPVDKVHHLDSASLESELYRLKTSFSNEKDRLLARITKANDELHTVLDRAPNQTPYASKQRSNTIQIPFRKLQSQAQGVYDCLAQQQPCSCQTPHVVGIATYPMFSRPPKGSQSKGLSLLFENEPRKTHLRVHVEVVSAQSPVEPAPEEGPAKVHREATAALKRRIDLKKQHGRVSDAISKKSISSIAATSSPVVIPPDDKVSWPRSILRKTKTKWQERSAVAFVTKKDSVPVLETASISSMGSASTRVLTKASTISTHTTATSSSSKISTPTSLPSRVRFAADQTAAPVCSASVAQEKLSICQLAMKMAASLDKKYPLEGSHLQIMLSPDELQQTTTHGSYLHNIDTVLASLPQRLERLYVGIHLALTLLSLVNSAWVHESLDVNHIAVISSGERRPHGLYFFSSISGTARGPIARWDARSSLLMLGVLLLELFHGEKLEKQACWQDSLDNGSPNEYSKMCGAFLWGRQSEAALEELPGKDAGGGLSEAIRKCVCYEFGYDGDLWDTRLVDLVYREVVMPLEKCCPPNLLKMH